MESSGSTARDQAMRLLREGSPTESIDFLRQAITEEPSDVDLYLFLGLAYAKTEELEKAIEVLENAVDVAPTSAKVHYNLGIAYQKSRNITLAKDEFLRALGLDPSYVAAKQALDMLSNQAADESANV